MSENGKPIGRLEEPGENATLTERHTYLKAQYEHLKKIHNAANEAIKNLHGALNIAGEENRRLRFEVVNATQNLNQQKAIVTNSLAQQDMEKKKLESEIIELRGQLKRVT